MPKVSIIVPMYNVERYIEKCLNSLVNQTLSEIEIIVVNDGSKDGTSKIAKEFFKRYPEKIRYFEKENGGLSDARNYGMQYATGEYIAFLDSDDYVELDMYEKMYQKAKLEKSDLVECDFVWEYPNKQKISRAEIYHNKKEMFIKARVVAWNKLIRRELLVESKVLYSIAVQYEDVDFFYKMIPYYDKISFVSEPYVHYVQRKNSISNSQNEKTRDIFKVLENVIQHYKNNNIYEEYKMEIEYIYARYLLCSSLLRMAKIKDKIIRNQLLNTTWENLNSNFPTWRKNNYLIANNTAKNLYLRTVNKVTYPIYCWIFKIIQ